MWKNRMESSKQKLTATWINKYISRGVAARIGAGIGISIENASLVSYPQLSV